LSFFNYPTYIIPAPEDSVEILVTAPILVVVQASAYGDTETTLLTKILGAVHQKISDVQLTQVSEGRHIRVLNKDQADQSSLIIVFGITPQMCGLQIDEVPYKRIRIGKETYLFSASLHELPSSPEARRALWVTLKDYFNLS